MFNLYKSNQFSVFIILIAWFYFFTKQLAICIYLFRWNWLAAVYLLCDMYCQPSFDKVVPPSFKELGLADLVTIYSELCELGKSPVIVDAADLQQDPEVVQLSKFI